MAELLIVAVLAVVAGLVIGWLVASRRSGTLASELAVARTRAADADLIRQARDAVERERNEAMQQLAGLRAQGEALEATHRAALDQLARARELHGAVEAEHHATHRELASVRAHSTARDEAHRLSTEQMQARFDAVATKALETAQAQFLTRAHQRFAESEAAQGQKLSALLQPVNDRLQRYEEGVATVEKERRDAFGDLKGQIEQMRLGQERVSGEAAKLVNALRNAPKARGRWGEQSLKNVLEQSGLSPYADFQTEVSVDTDDGRLRPDVVVNLPGGRKLIIDAKCSLNAFLDAHDCPDELGKTAHLKAHLASVRNHVQQLGSKAYWQQFGEAADYVVMYIPGEHFLTAAMEQDAELWDWAHGRGVLLATPINLIAIARTVAAVWRQEKLTTEAREIGVLGREIYARIQVMAEHVIRMGRSLDGTVEHFNRFIGSLDRNVLTTAKKLEGFKLDGGGKQVEVPALLERHASSSTKLIVREQAAE